MPMEPNIYALYAGKQTAKLSEQTTAAKRFVQVGGDMNVVRDDGSEAWSDMSKYGAQTRWINSLLGNGAPAIEGTPNELGWLLWMMHGAETFTAGTDNVQTLGNNPSSGSFTLNFFDGATTFTVGPFANTLTAAALDTAMEAALAAGGYAATQVVCAGGPLNTTPITVTFNGTQTSKRPWATMTKTLDTTSPAVSIVNTTPGVRAKHVFVPQATAGFWATFMKRIGTSVIQRQSFIDCLIGGMTLEGSTSAKALRATPTILSLDPAKVLAADPTGATLPLGSDAKPFLYNESSLASSTGFVLNGTALAGTSDFSFVINEDRSAVYGDDVVPFDLVVGQPSASIAVTLIFDSAGLTFWNTLVYGTGAPTAGTKPQRFLPPDGSFACDFKQKDGQGNVTGNDLAISIPRVAWNLPDAPGANPGGGAVSISLSGTMLPPAGVTPPYTLTLSNGDGAAYS
jgi:hypothetical protein